MNLNRGLLVFSMFLLLAGVLLGLFGSKNSVLHFGDEGGSTTLQSLTGVLIDKDKKPIVGADMFVGILEKKDDVINPASENKLFFEQGEPQQGDCTLRDDFKYAWFEEFSSATNNDGRVDLMLGSTKDLRLKMNGRYLMEVRFKKKGSDEWQIIDLNPAVEDSEDETTCAQEFQAMNGPGEGEITSIEIGDKQVGSNELADYSVTQYKIADNSIDAIKLKDKAVTSAKIDSRSVLTDKILEKAVTADRIADETITNGNIAPAANIAWTKISSNAPWYDGMCEVQVSADLEDWFSEGTYVGGVSKYYYAKDGVGATHKFEERPTDSPASPTTIYKDDDPYSTGGVTKYKKLVEEPDSPNCWADRGIAPYCNTLYSTNTACMQAGGGRCTSFEGEFEECVTAPKYWAEYAPASCTSVTYGQTYFKYLRVYCH